MGNFNRIINHNILPPERSQPLGAEEWEALEASFRQHREEIEEQGMQETDIGTLDY